MARGKLNHTAARAAYFEHHRRTGQAPSYEALRTAAGGGSHRDLQCLMEEFGEEAAALMQAEAVLPNEMMDEFKLLLTRAFRHLKVSADTALDAVTKASDEKVAAVRAHNRELVDALDHGQAERASLVAENALLQTRLEAAGRERDDWMLRATQSEAELKVFREWKGDAPVVRPRRAGKAGTTAKSATTGAQSTVGKRKAAGGTGGS